MIAPTRFKFAAAPIIGSSNFVENFVEGVGIHSANRVVTVDVDADTGRHRSLLDPTGTDGCTGTRHIATRGVRRCGGAEGVDAAQPVTHRHDAVLLTLRKAYKQRQKNDCKTAATPLTLYWQSPGRPGPSQVRIFSCYPAAGGRATKLGRKPYCGMARP